MEFITGLFFGYALTWPSLIVLCILGIIFEANEAHGFAMFTGIIAAILAYFLFHVDPMSIIIYIVGYFVIGVMWSIWRYKRHAMNIVAEYKDYSEHSRKVALSELNPSRMLNTITTWVLVWPFSMIENVSGDLIKLVQTTLTTVFKSIFHKIYQQAVGQLFNEEEPPASLRGK